MKDPTPTVKERILAAVRDLPADAGYDDALECIVLMAQVDEGLAQLEAGEGIPHEEVERRLTDG